MEIRTGGMSVSGQSHSLWNAQPRASSGAFCPRCGRPKTLLPQCVLGPASAGLFFLKTEAGLSRRCDSRRGIGFDPVYLRDEITPMIPGQTVAIDPPALKAFRPSYRFLSYCFASVGYPVPNDLAGVDRPDLVDALVREIYGWAGLAAPH